MSEIFYIKQNDTLPSLLVENMAYGDGTPVVFAAGDVGIFNMRLASDPEATPKISGGAVTLNTGLASCVYPWQPNDTDTAGDYHAEVEVTFASGGKATWPNFTNFIIRITDDLDNN